jgi:predicted NBD/HSP70 family sugar kinase
VLAEVARICRDSLDDLDRPVLGVGCAVPAVVGADQTVLRAPNLPRLNGLPVGERLATLLALPGVTSVLVENEANLGALARLQAGGGSDFVYVSGEIGVGAGLVVGGELFRGVHGFAGELGHVVVQADGPECGCGGQGCVEQYAGQEVLLRSAARPDVASLLAAVAEGEPAACAAVECAAVALGVGLSSLLNVVDVPTVVLGGLYARLFDVITPTLEAELARRVLSAPAAGGGRLRRSALGPDAAVRGAAGLIVERALKDPTLLLS